MDGNECVVYFPILLAILDTLRIPVRVALPHGLGDLLVVHAALRHSDNPDYGANYRSSKKKRNGETTRRPLVNASIQASPFFPPFFYLVISNIEVR